MTALDRLRIGFYFYVGFAWVGAILSLWIDALRPWAYHVEAFAFALLVGFALLMWVLYVGALAEEIDG